MEKIAKNLNNIKKIIKNANNKNSQVDLIAVTKGFSEDVVKQAINVGLTSFGENKVQECDKKFSQIIKENNNIKLHLIGPLQTNKVKKALEIFNTIHTLDREKLASEIYKNLSKTSKTAEFFIQINTGSENQKSGVLPNESKPFITWCKHDLRLNVVGLMCIPPISESPSGHFLFLKEIAKKNHLDKLSMGMSGDFKEAIVCGSTHIRIGTLLFGERRYNLK